jgi:hypothetical protein
MSSSGTLLSDLQQSGSPGDDDLVKQIFKDMNQPVSTGSMVNSPNPNTYAPIAMDPNPATSHVIGRDHPTPADFAAAMHGVRDNAGGMPNMMPPPQGQFMPQAQGQFMPQAQGQWQGQQVQLSEGSKRNIYSRVADEVKTPILVTLLVFVFSIPVVNVLFSHYIPSLVKPTGDLTTVGVLVKSVLAGATFWILQRVVAPLISL